MRMPFLIAFLQIFFGCTPLKKTTGKIPSISVSQIKFLGEYDVPNGKQFRGTTIGGLSGIDYDPHRGVYYIISDDRTEVNAARFYTAKIHLDENGIDSVEFTGVTTLLQKDGKPYPSSKQDRFHTPDPEALRFNASNNELVWSSEGERIVSDERNVLEDPMVIVVDTNGNYKDSFALPANMHMHVSENGPRRNGVFEGMTFSGDGSHLFVSVEEPIYEDGPRAGLKDSTARIRIIKFDVNTRKPVAQYAYQVEPVAYPPVPANAFKINGVPDILWSGQNDTGGDDFIVVERSFSTGRTSCTIKVFFAGNRNATDIKDISSIRDHAGIQPLQKRLWLNMDSLGRYIDNIEGVTFGPSLPNGHGTLIFVADDNFSALEKTQFLVFEIIP